MNAYAACAQAEHVLATSSALFEIEHNILPIFSVEVSGDDRERLFLDLIEIFNAIYSQRPRRVLVTSEHSASLPIMIDKRQLRLCLWNVIDNAFIYGFEGSPIRIITSRFNPATMLRVAVFNHGLPIHADEIGRCCDPGFRGANAEAVAPGAGLGLYVASRLLSANGGSLHLESNGNVTTAELLVPLSHPR